MLIYTKVISLYLVQIIILLNISLSGVSDDLMEPCQETSDLLLSVDVADL